MSSTEQNTSTALVPVSLGGYQLMTMDTDDLREVFAENLGGEAVKAHELDRIKVPAAGVQLWSIPGLDGEEYAKSLEGVVILWKTGRLYFAHEYSGGGTAPECVSDDGIHGVGDPAKACGGLCANCALNEWETDIKGGKGKACKEVRLLFLLRQNGLLPVVVSVPPTSLKPVRDYFRRLLTAGKAYHGVVTRLDLEKAQQKGGSIEYSRIKFSSAGTLDPAAHARVKEIADALRPVLMAQTVTPDDFESVATDTEE